MSDVARTAAPERMASTSDRLLDEAERLFAKRGVDRVASREIVEAADQRNVSAISYHFGSREQLLLAILARRGGPVDIERGRRRDASGGDPSVGELVACLVEPYAALLDDAGGRAYVRIVAQLRGRFAAWRIESDMATTVHMARILDEIESRAPGTPTRQSTRVVGMIMLLTGLVAERSRLLDEGADVDLGAADFVTEVTAMCTAVVATS